METNNFIVENKVKFLTNKSDYPHQPVFTMLNNLSMTGVNFISLYRYVTNDEFSDDIPTDEDAKLVLHISNDNNVHSATGEKDIKSMGIIRSADELSHLDVTATEEPRCTTAEPFLHTIITSVSNQRADVVVSNGGLFTRDIVVEDIISSSAVNFMGTSFRPHGTGANANGVGGNSLVLQYYYCREEIGVSSLSAVSIADHSGNLLHGDIYGQGAGEDPLAVGRYESGTVTGWEHGPIEGCFRMEGSTTTPTYLESPNSSLFHNYTDLSTSGITMMAHLKFNSTGDTRVMSLVSTSGSLDPIFGLSLRNGSLVVDSVDSQGNRNSVTAGKYVVGSPEDPNATFRHTDIGRWMHVCARVDMTEDTPGTSIFINGEAQPLLGTQSSLSADMKNIIKVNNGSKFNIGIDKDLSSSALTGCVGVTRIFNAALTDQEIFQNYIATIPTNMVIESIKIG